MTPRTCALCGERDASTVTDLDGRPVPACARCLAPVRDPARPFEPVSPDGLIPPKVRDRATIKHAILTVVAKFEHPVSAGDIASVLGHMSDRTAAQEAQRTYEAISASLRRLVKRGELAAFHRDPAVPQRGYVYTLPERAAC